MKCAIMMALIKFESLINLSLTHSKLAHKLSLSPFLQNYLGVCDNPFNRRTLCELWSGSRFPREPEGVLKGKKALGDAHPYLVLF